MKTLEKNRFQWGPFLKAVAAISIPIALSNLLTTTGSMVDTMMIATLGENSVAAVGLCAQFSSLMFSCYWGFVGGGILFFSQYWGSKEDRGIERSYGIVLVCLMIVAAVFWVLATFFPHFVMEIYTDKESIQKIGVAYLKIVGFAYPLQIYAIAMSMCLRSTERVRIPLVSSIISVFSNFVLNWILIFGHFGFPAMGVRGAALATTLAAAINVLVILVASRATGFLYLFHVRNHFAWDRKFLGLFFRKCYPMICNELFIGVGNMVINIALGHQSEPTIAAVAVFRTLEGFIIAFFTGFASAASVLIGKRVGSGELEDAYQGAVRLVYICQAVIFSAMVLVLSVHTPLLHMMSLHGESFETCTSFLWIFSFFGVIRMGNWAQNEVCRSSGDSTTGTVLEIAGMAGLVVPAVSLSAFVFHAPVLLVFICCYIDEPIRYVLMQRHMYSARWMKPVTDLGRAELEAFLKEKKKRNQA